VSKGLVQELVYYPHNTLEHFTLATEAIDASKIAIFVTKVT